VSAQAVDWDALMRAGLGGLGLAPQVFWTMTPVEFRRALEGAGLARPAARPMTRARLEALMATHPDRPTGDRHGPR